MIECSQTGQRMVEWRQNVKASKPLLCFTLASSWVLSERDYASTTLCLLQLLKLARLPMMLKKIRWEGMGYSRINSNRVSKLLHLSKRSNNWKLWSTWINKWNWSQCVLLLFIFMQSCVWKQNSKEDKIPCRFVQTLVTYDTTLFNFQSFHGSCLFISLHSFLTEYSFLGRRWKLLFFCLFRLEIFERKFLD